MSLPPTTHRPVDPSRGAGVTGAPLEAQPESANPHDRGHDANIHPGFFQPCPLFDMQLDIPRQRRRIAARSEQTVVRQSMTLQACRKLGGRGPDVGQIALGQVAGQSVAAQQSADGALLVGKGDGLQMARPIDAGLFDRL